MTSTAGRPSASARTLTHVVAGLLISTLLACGSGGDGGGSSSPAPSPAPAPAPVPAPPAPAPTPAPPTGTSSGDPVLLFSDLVSGPDTGLGDGLGSGVIVTVWGQGLGSAQGGNSIEFCDSASQCRTGHVYYWKNADGALPSGPANLHASHGMQEIAFSIPDSAPGAGTIRVTVGTETSTLPFIVRPGQIYHVKANGSDSNPGTFTQPWASSGRVGSVIAGGTTAPAGSTVYFHNVTAGTVGGSRGIYINNSAATAPDATTNFFYTTYPGTRSTATGREGFTNYRIDGTAISKFRLEAANCDEGANGQPINCISQGTWGVRTDKWGRVIANYFTDPPGRCSSNMQGAIVGGASSEDDVSNAKILGNEIEQYGCPGSDVLHHTTYLSIRSAPDNLTVEPWEFGWNYLHDNHTKSGIHQFDQNTGCGTPSGPLVIRNNVVINQAGPGIYVGGQCGWSMDAYIENNVVINAGRSVDWDGLNPNTSQQTESGSIVIRDSGTGPTGGLLGTMYIRNNTVHGWGWDGMARQGEGCLSLTGSGDNVRVVFTDNSCTTASDRAFVGLSGQSAQQADNISGRGNAFFYAGTGTPTAAVLPGWDATPITTNPGLTLSGARFSVGPASPLLNRSATTLPRDIYGQRRGATSNVGAVQ